MKKETKPKKRRNNWTQWFIWTLQFTLDEYEDKIQFLPEYELFSKPPRIDVVIIKLLEDIVIENTVGKFFNRHNIIEFKGPKDTLNIEAFNKVIGYSFFYISQNNISVKDAAISFVSVKYPKKLISFLKKEKIYEIIPSNESGIYYILPRSKDNAQTPKMQLVVSSELSAQDVLWLEMLRDDLSAQGFNKCLELYENTEKYKEQVEEILRGLLVVNNETLEKEGIMTATEKKFNEIVARWAVRTGAAQTWEQQGKQEGMQQGIQQGMQQIFAFLKSGHTLEEAEKKFSFA